MEGYIDVRNIHPVLFVGLRGYVLWGQHRSITVAAARLLVGLPVIGTAADGSFV